MTSELSPKQACETASSAYPLRLSSSMIDAAAAAPSTRDEFGLVEGVRLTSSTGMGPVSRETGFGYVAFGKPGRRQGECLISIRGTEKTSGHDWLTNLRIAGTPGPEGNLVHAGFWALANGLLPKIREGLRGRSPALIHVVGHSLGGATATLVADVLHREKAAAIKLYTLGAPRAGVEGHARALTAGLGSENIFRAWHHNDPVPMVPVFPYAHVPVADEAYFLHGLGSRLSVDAHLLPSYLGSISDRTWAQLHAAREPQLDTFEAAEKWLAAAAHGQNWLLMFSAHALRMILAALRQILKKVGQGLGLALLGGCTLIDQIANLLYQGVLRSAAIARSVENMVSAALRFAGRIVSKAQQVTEAFLHYVLSLLFRIVASAAFRALNLV